MEPKQRFRYSLLTLMLLQAAMVLPILGARPLRNVDEGPIAEISREMAVTRDWIVPRLGGQPYACYPPFAFWTMAASGSILGFNEFAMRLPSALFGIALVGIVALLARRLAGDRAGLIAGLIFATTHAFVQEQVMCRANVMVAFFAMLAFERFLAITHGENRLRNYAILYGSIALGILAKGPLGLVIPGLAIVAWRLVGGTPFPKLKLHFGIPLVVLLVAPWYIAVYRAAGWEFIHINLILENFAAFTTGHEQARPFWFYFQAAPARLLPWGIVLIAALSFHRERAFRIALASAAAVFLFITISSAKRVSYLVFIFPLLAVATGIAADLLMKLRPNRIGAVLLVLGGAMAGVSLVYITLPATWRANAANLGNVVPWLLAALVLGGIVTLLVTLLRGPQVGMIAVGATLAIVMTVYHGWSDTRIDAQGRNAVAFCGRIAAAEPHDASIGTLGPEQMDGFFYFYTARNFVRRDDLSPGLYLVSSPQYARVRQSPSRVEILDRFEDSRGVDKYFIKVLP